MKEEALRPLKKIPHPEVLAATYDTVSKQIKARTIPTLPLSTGQTIFRYLNAHYLPKPQSGTLLPRKKTESVLYPRDGLTKNGLEGENRFSGPSGLVRIPPASGLYCVLQQQALVNEAMHYAQKSGIEKPSGKGVTMADEALKHKCVVKLLVTMPMQVAELSPHNPGLEPFAKAVESSAGYLNLLRKTYGATATFLGRIEDKEDYSVARGVGLAVAHSQYMDGLAVQTVRLSERSGEEKGDNLILFGSCTNPIKGVTVVSASYFQTRGKMETFQINRHEV